MEAIEANYLPSEGNPPGVTAQSINASESQVIASSSSTLDTPLVPGKNLY